MIKMSIFIVFSLFNMTVKIRILWDLEKILVHENNFDYEKVSKIDGFKIIIVI